MLFPEQPLVPQADVGAQARAESRILSGTAPFQVRLKVNGKEAVNQPDLERANGKVVIVVAVRRESLVEKRRPFPQLRRNANRTLDPDHSRNKNAVGYLRNIKVLVLSSNLLMIVPHRQQVTQTSGNYHELQTAKKRKWLHIGCHAERQKTDSSPRLLAQPMDQFFESGLSKNHIVLEYHAVPRFGGTQSRVDGLDLVNVGGLENQHVPVGRCFKSLSYFRGSICAPVQNYDDARFMGGSLRHSVQHIFEEILLVVYRHDVVESGRHERSVKFQRAVLPRWLQRSGHTIRPARGCRLRARSLAPIRTRECEMSL